MGFFYFLGFPKFSDHKKVFLLFLLNLKSYIVRKNIQSVFLIFLLTSFSAVTAQSTDLEKLTGELLLIADNFAAPGAEGAAVQSSAGWFTSARSLEKWQVEVSVHGNALFVPRSKQNKLISNSNLAAQHPGETNILNIQGSSNALLPTVFGGETDVIFEGSILGQSFNFDAIDGLDKNVLVHPFPQVTVGLPYDTEVAARYLPSIVINDVGFSTYGIGFKHNFTQYYERRYNPEDFQFAAVVTYSNFKVDYAFTPVDIQITELNRIDVDANLWLGQIMGSKLYDTFEVFGALGVTNSNFDYAFGGSGVFLGTLNEELEALGATTTQFKGDLGFNYYFDKFKISTMFTAGSLFNANIGLHYRI